jgi:diamine N-acetyltransferase
MILSNSKVALRALEPTDLELIHSWENNPELWEVSDTHVPFSKFVLTQYLKTQHVDIYTSKQLRLVAMDKDKVPVGLIDLFDFNPRHKRAGVGILIDAKERGKGYAQESLKLLEEYCFKHLDLYQIYANVGINNKPSLSLFESLNYIKAGVKKDWVLTENGFVDEVLYQKLNT